MTKLEALALAVFSIIVMYGVFWVKAVYVDRSTVAQVGASSPNSAK